MRIGRYRIQRQIAQGGQGSVLLGYDPQLRRPVAIKLYRLPDQRESRRQALREARRSALPASSHITRVHDVLVAGNDLAVIMEYVPGCDLRDVLRGTRLSLAASLSIASDIAAALSAARLLEIVHGDIKPANVLIADSGRAMLTDFGVAQVGGGAAIGFSRNALTPEHVLGEPLCHASDLFALGVLIYHLVSGVRPFADGEAGRQAMCKGRFLSLQQRVDDSEIPSELSDLVTRLLAPDPRQRPDSTHAVRQALRAVSVALPLGEAAPVRAETRAFYRSESATDVPPGLAAQFGAESRGRRVARRLGGLAVRRPLAAALAGLALLSLGFVAWLVRPVPCIELQAAELRVDAATTITADISREWLQRMLGASVGGRAATAELVGALSEARPRVIGRTARAAECSPDQRLQLRLECRRALCLLSLLRNALPVGSGIPLFADASTDEWRSAIDRLALEALP